MEISHLRELVKDDFSAVNDVIFEKIQSEISLIDDLTHYVIESGGKRIRPLLVLLASHACGYEGMDHIRLAAGLEFFHTATLLHDDVIDESHLRRGRETAHKIWGSKASILVGDYLFTQYMQIMVDVGNLDIMRLLTKISHQIGCGELRQLTNRHNTALNLDDYFSVIEAKTSLLFAASSSMGAMISHSNESIRQSLYDYGLHLGNAFQLIDDALDFCSDAETIGKNIGDDLADGKATLPLIHVLQQGKPEQKAIVRTSLEQGSLAYLPAILEAIAETKAIEHTRKIAAIEVEQAIFSLQKIPQSVYKDALVGLAYFAVERQN